MPFVVKGEQHVSSNVGEGMLRQERLNFLIVSFISKWCELWLPFSDRGISTKD